ncbi:Adenylate kinase (ATP-AMP transphosphorylase) [Mycoplasma suis KI3806]|uniref:Adenylate kinase n=1 Tax=Mycoplasma suis (strain KI_3806) TaxID=708248 RepID=F0V3Q0_MYCS3|nr:nucleoside monophosphate kinase [Mycoplasma suis]CBZ40472.1 Adenylate kinase (ATP-AMP transphosphorylase) [Mycoplasma suis KI3806]
MVDSSREFTLIVLIAPPGSGKGTLSELLKERKGIYVLSAGKIFRTLIAQRKEQEDNSGEKLQDVNKGGYLADEVVNKYAIAELERIQQELIEKNNSKKLFITLDGYPRTMGQAKELERWSKDKKLIIVTLEGLSDIQIQERLSNRYLCQEHEHIFNALNKDFPTNGICPKDGSKLIKRVDDSQIEVMQKRLNLHRSLTSPICEYYKSQNITTITIDSSLTIEGMYLSFCEKLGI